MRLVLIPSIILALGIIAAIGVTLYGAKSRIVSEIDSGLTLGDHLIGYALDDLASRPDQDASAQSAALQRLRQSLKHVRHIKVSYLPDAAPESPDPSKRDASHKARGAAPGWFLNLLKPPKIEKSYPVVIGGAQRGKIIMTSEASDEIAEIWAGLVFLTALLGVISAAIVTLILVTARHTLAPIHQLVEGLDRLGRGQFEAVGEIRIAELRRVGEHFNKLALTLARSEANNHLLIDRLLSVQDAERKELARELHDEFGASLFGIRAAASCIIEAAATNLPDAELRREIVDRAENASALADAIQKQNYRILDRIRPVILHQMGLPDALKTLVDAWCAQHRDFVCAIKIPAKTPAFSEEISLTSYRVVQECLTNAARHSKARSVRITMDICPSASPEGRAIRLAIEDDGVGLPDDFRYGFGFLGMSERVRKLGGHLNIGRAATGTLIEALIPIGEAACSESKLFDPADKVEGIRKA